MTHPTGLGEYTSDDLTAELVSRYQALGVDTILFTQQQVEQMMSELIGEDDEKGTPRQYQDESSIGANVLRGQQRQSIPSIIKKYGGK